MLNEGVLRWARGSASAMPKLARDQIQKCCLSLIGLAILVYCYFTLILGPLAHNKEASLAAIADTENKIADGKKIISGSLAVEKSASESLAKAKARESFFPSGAPVAWFPPKIKAHFAAGGIEVGSIRSINLAPLKEPAAKGYSMSDWSIEIPRADFLALCGNLARIENEEPFLRFTAVRIHALAEDPSSQAVTLGVNRLVRD